MKVLVTAGSTIIPIDKVRVISNIFHGKTGTNIAGYFASQGDDVYLLTSNPGLVARMVPSSPILSVFPYRTYDELAELMQTLIGGSDFDVIIHSAAVSDYYVSGVFVKDGAGGLQAVGQDAKISSAHKSLFLEMKPT